MVSILTISREFGSGGGPIGAILARRLGWRLVDDPLVADIAAGAQVSAALAASLDERVDPWFHRLTKAIARGGFEAANPTAGVEPFDAERMAALWTRVIEEAADLGHCVIVGRGGMCLLQERPGAFHVSVHAPTAFKLGILKERYPELTAPQAKMIETDNRRKAYIQRHFNRDWTDRRLFHLVINAAIGLKAAANAIMAATQLDPVAD